MAGESFRTGPGKLFLSLRLLQDALPLLHAGVGAAEREQFLLVVIISSRDWLVRE